MKKVKPKGPTLPIAAAGGETSGEGKTRTSQASLARRPIDALRELQSAIPNFVLPGPEGFRGLSARGVMPVEALEIVAVMVENDPELFAATGVDPDRLREKIAFVAAFEAVADQADTLARGVRYTIAVQKAEAADDARQVYEMAKVLARKPECKKLLRHVEEIRKLLSRPAARSKAAAAAKAAPAKS